MADAGQLEQVVMNLVTNARDAMPGGGSLTLRTGLVKLDDAFLEAHGYGNHGSYVFISVSDTGVGIDKETREKIFQPFFTTKVVGKGTGLGLAMVYGIVTQHQGYIMVESEPGKGTTFTVYLPAITPQEEALPTTADSPLRGGTETILVAEDDEKVRKLSDIVLREYGYEVILAEDGEDAVRKFIENMDRIQLVILDVIMPKKSGKEAYEEIKRLRHEARVLFSSGYTADRIDRGKMIEEGFDFIVKPAQPKDLLRKVREILDK
jgi:CheY-like chemotaxis protein